MSRLSVSRFALECSISALFNADTVRLWTFTLPSFSPDWLPVSDQWHRFMKAIGKHHGRVPGVRVCEWHPGGHGWHIHWLVHKFLPVSHVRPAALRCGFGRINVLKMGQGTEAEICYFSKHFSKDIRRRAHGMRKWACTGKFNGTRIRDVKVESSFCAWLRLRTGGRRLTYKEYQLYKREYLVGPPLKYWNEPFPSPCTPARTPF